MFNRPRKYMYTCILVGLLTGGCYSIDPKTVSPGPQDTDSYTDTDTDTDVDTDTDIDEECDWTCETVCDSYSSVPLEPPGTPAQQDAVCFDPSIPVQSNTAARVTLNAYSSLNNLATGHVEIPSDLIDHVIGIPTIEVANAFPSWLAQMNVSNLQPATGGFDFEVSWDAPFTSAEIQVRVILEVDCTIQDGGTVDAGLGPDAGGATRLVQSLTNIIWCYNHQNSLYAPCSIMNWVSSGDPIFEDVEDCWNSCEMAPTPIMPDPVDDGLALPFALKVEIDELVRFDRSVVLIAEHSGTQGQVEYEWRVSAGEISEDNLGGVVWDLPKEPGPHLVQVAIKNSSSAAVAGLRVRHLVN